MFSVYRFKVFVNAKITTNSSKHLNKYPPSDKMFYRLINLTETENIYLNYRLTSAGIPANDGANIAFAVFNHRGERVYKIAKFVSADSVIAGKESFTETEAELVACRMAVSYFSNYIRSRYYDEHFATILEEDGLTAKTLTPLPEKESFDKGSDTYIFCDMLTEFIERPSITFAVTDKDDAEMKYTLEILKDIL